MVLRECNDMGVINLGDAIDDTKVAAAFIIEAATPVLRVVRVQKVLWLEWGALPFEQLNDGRLLLSLQSLHRILHEGMLGITL